MLVFAVGVARSIATPLVVSFRVLQVFNVCTVLSILWFDGGAVAFVVVLSISGSVRCGNLYICVQNATVVGFVGFVVCGFVGSVGFS